MCADDGGNQSTSGTSAYVVCLNSFLNKLLCIEYIISTIELRPWKLKWIDFCKISMSSLNFPFHYFSCTCNYILAIKMVLILIDTAPSLDLIIITIIIISISI